MLAARGAFPVPRGGFGSFCHPSPAAVVLSSLPRKFLTSSSMPAVSRLISSPHLHSIRWLGDTASTTEDSVINIPTTRAATKDRLLYPEFTMQGRTGGGKNITYRLLRPIERYAERISEIMSKNDVVGAQYHWFRDPKKVTELVRNGSYAFYGGFRSVDTNKAQNLELAVCVTLMQENRTCFCIFAASHPDVRGQALFKDGGELLTRIGSQSGADLTYCNVISIHPSLQAAVEDAGFLPCGFFPGGELVGTSDKQFRFNVLWYVKIHNKAKDLLFPWGGGMRLIKDSPGKNIVDTVQKIWEDAQWFAPDDEEYDHFINPAIGV